jgi:hypothetical protein
VSIETLRRAAALMRERAEAATPGPWAADPDTWHPHGHPLGYRRVVSGEPNPISGIRMPHLHTATLVPPGSPEDRAAMADAEHIASWHPAVALASAKALDEAADAYEEISGPNVLGDADADPLLAALIAQARAYLGEQS